MDERNVELARYIAIDESRDEVLLPKFGWYHRYHDSSIMGCKTFDKLVFDKDWNLLMLVCGKLLDDAINLPLGRIRDYQIDNIMTNVGTCDIKQFYDFVLKKLDI